jgi:hypothetical protein
MRKFLIGYPVWQARMSMLEWLLTGIKENIDPARADVVFYLDEHTLGDQQAFAVRAAAVLPGFTLTVAGGSHELREIGCHNWFISRMMDGNHDCLIVPQDDLRLSGATILTDLGRVLDQYGERIGYVGMREGYGYGLQGMVSSPFDAKIATPKPVEELPVGTWREAIMVNPGPLVYPRSTVEKIGCLDVSFHNWQWWADYALRARAHGLVNGVVSISADHAKCGEVRSSRIYAETDWVTRDIALLNRRWRPIVGQNVI